MEDTVDSKVSLFDTKQLRLIVALDSRSVYPGGAPVAAPMDSGGMGTLAPPSYGSIAPPEPTLARSLDRKLMSYQPEPSPDQGRLFPSAHTVDEKDRIFRQEVVVGNQAGSSYQPLFSFSNLQEPSPQFLQAKQGGSPYLPPTPYPASQPIPPPRDIAPSPPQPPTPNRGGDQGAPPPFSIKANEANPPVNGRRRKWVIAGIVGAVILLLIAVGVGVAVGLSGSKKASNGTWGNSGPGAYTTNPYPSASPTPTTSIQSSTILRRLNLFETYGLAWNSNNPPPSSHPRKTFSEKSTSQTARPV
ncbi:hypothetical protein BC829DRAFT_138188 [Chytridium lagenaria]|nr:hypothetical protein BC829DRAFT_138188 [Chytridium lagenaria]